MLLLLTASVAGASPTIISDSPAPVISSSADHAAGVATCNPGSDTASDQMSEFATAILQPPQVNNQTTQAGDNHYLPALPPAIAMVLTGFICVSLVRDRRTWLTAVTFTFGMGLTGIQLLPHAFVKLGRLNRAATRSYSQVLYHPQTDDIEYISNSELGRFIGLLYHLNAIPHPLPPVVQNSIRVAASRFNFADENSSHFGRFVGKVRTTCAVFTALLSLTVLSLCCPAYLAEQFVCFTPAFIFNLIPRGPPIS